MSEKYGPCRSCVGKGKQEKVVSCMVIHSEKFGELDNHSVEKRTVEYLVAIEECMVCMGTGQSGDTMFYKI